MTFYKVKQIKIIHILVIFIFSLVKMSDNMHI